MRFVAVLLLSLPPMFIAPAFGDERPKVDPESPLVKSFERAQMRNTVRSMLAAIKQYPDAYAKAVDDPENVFRKGPLSDEMKLLLRRYVKACIANDEKAQNEILAAMERAPLLQSDADAASAKHDAATPAGGGAATPEPQLPLEDLFSQDLEARVKDYQMPVVLTSEEARDLIVKTDSLPERLDEFLSKQSKFSGRKAQLVEDRMLDRFWNRIANQEGFKDPTLAADWGNFALEQFGFVNAIEELFSQGAKSAAVEVARNRLDWVRLRIVAGKVTFGDRLFVRQMHNFLESTITKLDRDTAMLDQLLERCRKEGLQTP